MTLILNGYNNYTNLTICGGKSNEQKDNFIYYYCFIYVFHPDYASGIENTMALHIGSPLILSEGKMKPLDSNNPNVVPIIHNDRTLHITCNQ